MICRIYRKAGLFPPCAFITVMGKFVRIMVVSSCAFAANSLLIYSKKNTPKIVAKRAVERLLFLYPDVPFGKFVRFMLVSSCAFAVLHTLPLPIPPREHDRNCRKRALHVLFPASGGEQNHSMKLSGIRKIENSSGRQSKGCSFCIRTHRKFADCSPAELSV